MKIFSFFLLLLAFPLNASVDPDKTIAEKINLTPDLKKKAEAFYKTFKAPSALMSETAKFAEQVQIRTSVRTGSFYDVFYRIKPLLALAKDDFQSWYIYLHALMEAKDKGYSVDLKELDYLTLFCLKAAKTLQDKQQIIWKRKFQENQKKQGSYKKRHTELTLIYPKQFAPYKIDRPQNKKLASVCFVTTQNLSYNRLFDYKPYVTVTPELPDFSVSGRGNNLCVEGFDYGKEYQLKLKKGLVSDQQIEMEKDYDFPIYIQHRKPSLSFRESGYILPAKGPQILPLNTVNLAKAHMQLYRIPARNYASFKEYDRFLSRINYSYQVDQITKNQAEKIWQGHMETEHEMNKTVTHGISVSSFLKKALSPGLYLMTAEDGAPDESSKRLLSTQWFLVSDLGVSAYKGANGIDIFTHSLSTAKTVRTEMTLIAYNNKILGKVEADRNGHGHFSAAITRGTDGNRPRYIYVRRGQDDFTFLTLKAQGFDFKDRGVKGRDPSQDHNGFMYTERGVYRPGEEVNITGLVRNKVFKVEKGQKLTLKIYTPQHKEVLSEFLQDQGSGSYAYTYELPKSARQGQWKAKLFLDPKAKEISQCSFEINDYVPPKVDVQLSSPMSSLMPGQDVVVDLAADYYYGKKAVGLKVKGRADLVLAKVPFKGYEKASFGFEEEQFLPLQFTFAEQKTDAEGKAKLVKNIQTKTEISAPLMLDIQAGINEVAGRYIQKKISVPYFQHSFYIGIIPEFKNRQAEEQKANFKIVSLDTDGVIRPLTHLKYSLLEEEQDFTWYRHSSQLNYESMMRTRVLKQGEISLNEDAPLLLVFDIPSYGRYRLEVVDPKTGRGASYRFSSGWSYGSSPDTPDVLDLHLDRKAYTADDDIKLKVKAPFEGRLMLLAVGPDKVIPIAQKELPEKGAVFDIAVPDEFSGTAGFYVVATALRPMDVDKNQMVSRAIGLAWVSLIRADLGSPLTLTHAKSIKSQSSLDLELSYDKAMKKAYATIAIVDDSVLDLTSFKSPDPVAYFFAQQNLDVQIFDVYGKLINPFGATLNDSLVGGDGYYGRSFAMLPANAFKTASLFSGIIELDGEGAHKISFDMPDFTGKARIMAVIWNDQKMASQSSTVLVKDDVVVDLALPRFLGTEDRAEVALSFSNTTQEQQDFQLDLAVSGPLQVENFPQKVSLAPEQSQNFPLTLWGQDKENVANIEISMIDSKAESRVTSFDVTVRSPLIDQKNTAYLTVEPGKEHIFTDKLLSGFVPGTATATLAFGSSPSFDIEALRKSLLDYEYGCVEQMTSKGYAKLLMPDETLNLKELTDHAAALVAYQTFSGEFVLWPGAYHTENFVSLYATEYLVKLGQVAQKRSDLNLPTASVSLGLRRLKEILSRSTTKDTLVIQTYAHYVLALADKNALSQVRFFADNNKLLLKTSKLGRAFMGAAFALLGDTSQAFEHFNQALVLMSDKDDVFSTALRDRILVLALLAETTENFPHFMSRVSEIAAQIAAVRVLSTQEEAWLLRLATFMAQEKSEINVLLKGEEKKGRSALREDLLASELTAGVSLKNEGQKALHVMVNVVGKASVNTKADKNSPFTIDRKIYTLSGKEHKGALKHGESYVFVVEGKIKTYVPRHLIVSDKLPAAIEIEEISPTLPWLKALTSSLYQEKRDDRFMASYKPSKSQDKFKFAYLIRVISQGEFTHPSPVIENMYQPQERAIGPFGKLNVAD